MRKSIKKSSELPPGPRGSKLYNLIKHMSDFSRFLKELREKYGDISYYKMPVLNYCIVYDLDLIHEVLTAKIPDPDNPDGPPVQAFRKFNPIDYMNPEKKSLFVECTLGLNGSDDAFYERSLKLMGPGLLGDKFLEAHSVRIIENIQALHARWKPGQMIHLWKELRDLQAHCVIRMNLGNALDAIRPSVVVDAMEGYKQDMILCALPGTSLLRKLPLPRSRSSKKSFRELSALIYKTIEQIRNGSHDPYCMASRLIDANTREEREGLLSDLEVHDLLVENITIPIDPTLIALTKAVGHIAYYPEVRRRLEEEVDDVLGDRQIMVEDYDKLSYTRAIMSETLRVGAPAPVLNRVTRQDYDLGGYSIPKETMVLSVIDAHNRNPQYWDQPEEFRPERWLEDPQSERPPCAYMPFGYDTRQCTGREFALRVCVYFLASTAQRLRLDTASPGPLKERVSALFLLSMVKAPVPMTVSKRHA